MRVAAVQHDIVWEDRDANFAHLDGLIDDAAQQREHAEEVAGA